jgi:hypothetical protein
MNKLYPSYFDELLALNESCTVDVVQVKGPFQTLFETSFQLDAERLEKFSEVDVSGSIRIELVEDVLGKLGGVA